MAFSSKFFWKFVKTLKNWITDVEEKGKGKSEAIEAILPGVCVNPGKDGGEGEEEDVDEEGRVDPWLCTKLMPK